MINYKEFYKSELFPDKDIEITDEYLIQHGWIRYDSDIGPKWYYFDGPIGRIKVSTCSEKIEYDLFIDHCREYKSTVYTLSDIKIAIYSYVCGMQAFKYGFGDVGYTWLPVYTEKEKNEFRYNKYCEMINWMK